MTYVGSSQQRFMCLPVRPALTARRHVDLARVSSAICLA
ncbi:putative leader peptide [Catenulispora yoronensis]